MTLSLYDAVIPSQLQVLRAVSGLLDKAQAFIAEQGMAESEVIEARIAPDMLSFAKQVQWVSTHSLGALEGLRRGWFSPEMSPPPSTLAALKEQIEATIASLEAVSPDELEGLIGQHMEFRMGERVMPFTAENFLLSFSQPNFYFHATTAYNLLRGLGLEIGKLDFMGRPQMKRRSEG